MVFVMGYGKVAQLTLMEVGFAMDFLERQFLIGKSAVSSVRRKTQIRWATWLNYKQQRVRKVKF